MKTPQFSTSKLSASSEYALILGAGASAAVSLAAQQVAAAALPLTTLVALGLVNRRRLDQRVKANDATGPVLEEATARQAVIPDADDSKVVTAQPIPEAMMTRLQSKPSLANNPLVARFSGRYASTTSSIAALQQASLQKIGAYLQHVREEKALSLRDIHDRTFIQVYMLKSIETGNLRDLPEPFYIRAFIQKYALSLGLKGQEIAAEFPME
ncbi:MAG: hypothetical protein F6K42_27170 [Leptolyngbya sp. SIO1D8]|nr:hypothetical protein [Leptolyngbya sp. SIO1D8]